MPVLIRSDRRDLRRGRWSRIAAVTAAAVLAGCTATDPTTSDAPGGSSAVASEAGAHDGLSDREDASDRDRGSSQSGLAGVDPTVANAVAPYDAASAVDSAIVHAEVVALTEEVIQECLRDHGFHESPPSQPPPDREVMLWEVNAEFPYIEGLEREGFRTPAPIETEADGDTPLGAWQPPPGYLEAHLQCSQALDEGASDPSSDNGANEARPAPGGRTDELFAHRADELFAQLRSAWQDDVMMEIETTDEIRAAKDEVAACVDAEGIPRREHNDDGSPADPLSAILGYTDGLKMRMGTDDPERLAEIDREYGQLYVACGRVLFEARERLRGGERRDAFLTEHTDAIRELSDLLTNTAASGGS